MTHDVFISYAAADKPVADAVCSILESNGIRCWIAPRDVLPGIPYAEALVDALSESRGLVLVFSSRSNDSEHVKREVDLAVGAAIPIIPLRIENVFPSKALKYYISSPHWLDALTPPLEHHLQRLAETLKVLLARGAGTVMSAAAPKDDARGEVVSCAGCGSPTPPTTAGTNTYCTDCGAPWSARPERGVGAERVVTAGLHSSDPAASPRADSCSRCGYAGPSALIAGKHYCQACGAVNNETPPTAAPVAQGGSRGSCTACGSNAAPTRLPSGAYCTNCGVRLS